MCREGSLSNENEKGNRGPIWREFLQTCRSFLGIPVDAAEADRRQLAKEYWADNTWKEIEVCTLKFI